MRWKLQSRVALAVAVSVAVTLVGCSAIVRWASGSVSASASVDNQPAGPDQGESR